MCCKLLTTYLVTVLLMSSLGAGSGNKTQVIGGRVVAESSAGWHVAVIHKRVLICSGSLVRRNVVLTAASCVHGLNPDHIVIRAGSIYFKKGGQIRNVLETVVHPEFTPDHNSNNIALIKLRKPFANTNGNNVKTLRIHMDESRDLPSALSVYGWGITKVVPNNNLTKKLRVAKFKVYSDRKCLPYLSDADAEKIEKVFCMGDRTKKVDICNDDFGTPAINSKYDTIYGIVSTNGACAENHTIIATGVAPHTPWINGVLKEW